MKEIRKVLSPKVEDRDGFGFAAFQVIIWHTQGVFCCASTSRLGPGQLWKGETR